MPPSNPTEPSRTADADLVARHAQSDGAAFEELYQRHAGRLYNLALRMVGPTDAEDLLQEIFLTAHRKLQSFKGQSSLGTWLYRLGINQCLDHVRSRAVKSGRLTDSLDDDRPARQPVDRSSGDLAVRRIDLERAIAQLPPAARAAFLLHDVEGFEHQQVAEILGIAEGTSKSQVHKARMRLRTLLVRPEAALEARHEG